jgi:hypothetical protein
MAYDRYDTRDVPREERSRWRDERDDERGDRGFFERAGDEVASWFGDGEAERRRREDRGREDGWNGRDRDRDYGNYGRDQFSSDRHGQDRSRAPRSDRGRDWYETRGMNERGGFSERDYNPSWQRELSGPTSRERSDIRDRDYRPMTGDYARGEREGGQFFAASGLGRNERGLGEDRSYEGRSQSPWGRDEYRSSSRAGTSDRSDRSRHEDPHYESWRQRHMNDLDRDYDDYRRENQSRFESDFGSWRDQRTHKRGLLGQIREHMEVVGNDDKHVGTVDKAAGDRLILTKSDPDSGGAHHSLSCSDVDRVEGDRVILDCTADQAKNRWRDESRNRALFEREEQGEMGPRMLNRSFEGTYR